MDDAIFNFHAGHRNRIIGCNRTGETILAYTPVEIVGVDRTRIDGENPLHVPFQIQKITPETGSIGVTAADIPAGSCGEIQIAGLARCDVAERPVTDNFALAGDGELIPASYGWPFFTIPQPERMTFVLLGGSFQRYLGSFAVIARENGYYCYDSAHPDSGVAGTTDLGAVPAGAITPVNGRFSLYLWYGNGSYHQSFVQPEVDTCGVVTLAELVQQTPRQCWTQGVIHWSQWYLL